MIMLSLSVLRRLSITNEVRSKVTCFCGVSYCGGPLRKQNQMISCKTVIGGVLFLFFLFCFVLFCFFIQNIWSSKANNLYLTSDLAMITY